MRLGYSSMTAGIYDLEEAFRLAERLELDFVELSFDVCNFLPEAQPERRVRELSRATGVGTTLHLPFIDLNIASLVKPVRQATLEQSLCGLEYAEAVGASCAVLHTGTVFIYQPRPLQDAVAALLDSLAALPNGGPPIVLENLGLYVDGLLRGPDMLSDVTRQSGMANCLDFAHAHIEQGRSWHAAAPGEDLIRRYLSTLGDKVLHLHLCNNDGIHDLHTATHEGTLDYAAYADVLAGFPGTICLEVSGGAESVRSSSEHIRGLAAAQA